MFLESIMINLTLHHDRETGRLDVHRYAPKTCERCAMIRDLCARVGVKAIPTEKEPHS